MRSPLRSQLRRRDLIATAGAAVLGGVLLTAGPAAAVQPAGSTTAVVSANPVNTTPHVLDGQVHAIAEVGNIGIVGGTFTQVRTAKDSAVVNRTNLFAFDITTGAILSSFIPSVPGQVYEIVPAGDGVSAYVAGQFGNIGGVKRTKRIARINVTSGAVMTSFVSPGFDGIIKDIAVRGDSLYVGGTFLTAGTTSQTLLARLNKETGALDTTFAPVFSGTRIAGKPMQVIKFDITPDGSKLVAIGNFTRIDGLDRYQIGMFDLTTSPASVTDWQTTGFTAACSTSFDTYMRDVDIDPTGSFFVVVTTGGYGGGPRAGSLCDAASRWELGTTGSGQQPTWVNYSGGDTFWSVAVTSGAIYVGGHFRWLNNPNGNDKAGAGAIARSGIGAIDPVTGQALSWNPGRTRGVGVFALVMTARGLWVGSDTDRIGNNEYHGRMALMPAA